VSKSHAPYFVDRRLAGPSEKDTLAAAAKGGPPAAIERVAGEFPGLEFHAAYDLAWPRC